MRVFAYVDAFNFYYGLTRYSTFKWCNLMELCRQILPSDQIEKVKVFTAYSKEYSDDREAPRRQASYLRALLTEPKLEIVTSAFVFDDRFMPLTHMLPTIETAQVRIPREKGSDVKLASHLLIDGFDKLYDMALVLTNDSDLATPIAIVRDKLQIPVFVGLTVKYPYRRVSRKLADAATARKVITDEMLKNSQFDPVIRAPNKTPIFKPKSW